MKASHEIIHTLIDLMQRDDRIQFGLENARPVTNYEWFGAIRKAQQYLENDMSGKGVAR